MTCHSCISSKRRAAESSSELRDEAVLDGFGRLAFLDVSVGGAGRHVDRRRAVEEPMWHEHEADAFHWHDRPVLQPWDMGEPKHIPENNVSFLQGPILLDPGS